MRCTVDRKAKCRVDDCKEPVGQYGNRGLCCKHYGRLLRLGRLELPKKIRRKKKQCGFIFNSICRNSGAYNRGDIFQGIFIQRCKKTVRRIVRSAAKRGFIQHAAYKYSGLCADYDIGYPDGVFI